MFLAYGPREPRPHYYFVNSIFVDLNPGPIFEGSKNWTQALFISSQALFSLFCRTYCGK